MKTFFLFSLLLLLSFPSIAQNVEDRAFILQRTNTKALQRIAEEAREHYLKNLALHQQKNGRMTIVDRQNRTGYLGNFDENGRPVYYFDDNEVAAGVGRVDKIWKGGESGLELDGTGVIIGHWESGVARTSHRELEGRITHAESANVTGHATHTAGTMIGTGQASGARGMASNASIISRNSTNDEAELAVFGASGGIISNHSYSVDNPDGNLQAYGKYLGSSARWDRIMYNAPYLFICKSAGNNRDDGVNTGDGGYDLIYTVGLAKNVLTVGAVEDLVTYTGPLSVKQADFNNWGPTDDWRIKPDLTTNGVSLFSADGDSDSDYDQLSGTSMSTAAVSGTVALLQQHYHNLNGVYMKSATVKALLLATTDEAGGHDGPDFQSGWGLLNAERAAEVISNNGIRSTIRELSLAQGDTYTTTIETDGLSPLILSIVWTDPAGGQNIGEDNQSPRLVNDLDLRVSGNGESYEPWVLTPNASSNNFTDAATKGDNFRDNVERIDAADAPAGIYTLTVSHKGNLTDNKQDFSLIVNGLAEMNLAQNEPGASDAISVYPNPSPNGHLSLSLPQDFEPTSYELGIYDLNGKRRFRNTYSNKQINLDVTDLASGVYLLVIRTQSELYRKLIVIN